MSRFGGADERFVNTSCLNESEDIQRHPNCMFDRVFSDMIHGA